MGYAAVDLGASSGRVIVAQIEDGRLDLTEAHRFANTPVRVGGRLHWDIDGLYAEVLAGLRSAAGSGLASVGIDSWAVDYGLLDGSGRLIEDPVHYRDGRTEGVMEAVVADVGADLLYGVSGLQLLPFNTVFQLMAEPVPERADTLLLIPDLLGYRLTGGAVGAETTNASTTALRDVRSGEWATELMETLDIPVRLFPPLRDPGSMVGHLTAETGLPAVPLLAVASHDTASAVLAVPAAGPRFAYVSSGTWSLVGVELDQPVLTADSRLAGFTNEVGLDGTIRYLRNVMGLWLLQECARSWNVTDLGPLLAAATDVAPFGALIDAADRVFLPPGDMPDRIAAYCVRTGQRPPADRAATVRCILESLALGHRAGVRDAVRLSGRDVDVVHIVGGGSRNEPLCQFTADACGLPVIAGPAEATAIGNALVQARADGFSGDLRELVRLTQPTVRYQPRGDLASWDRAAGWLGLP